MKYAHIIILIFFVSIAFIRLWCAYSEPYITTLANNTYKKCSGFISDYPDTRESFIYIYMDTEKISPCNGERILLRIKKLQENNFLPGDIISIAGKSRVVENFSTESGRIFNYKGYLSKESIYAIFDFPSVEYHGRIRCDNNIRSVYTCLVRVLYKVKLHISTTLYETISHGRYTALALGITLGEKRGLSSEDQKNFIRAGISHIVVLSGFNVTIIAYVLGSLLYGRVHRLIRLCGCISVLTLFGIFVGLGATVVRTVLVASILLFAEYVYRHTQKFRILILTLCSIAIITPLTALYDPSFHLSFLAVIGVMYIAPYTLGLYMKIIKKILERNFFKKNRIISWSLKSFGSVFCVTFGASSTTMPYIAWSMGTVSFWGLITNIVIVPIIPLIMGLTLLTYVGGVVSVYLGILSAIPLELLLRWVYFISELPSKIFPQ